MSMSWRRLDRLEVFKQLSIFTYPLQTKEGDGCDQTRDIQTIGLVHVHPREDEIGWSDEEQLTKFTYELEMREDVHDVNP